MCVGDTAAAGSSKILFYYSSSHLGLYQTFSHAVFPSSLTLESCLCYDSQISVSQAAPPSQVFSGSRKLYLQMLRSFIILGSIFGLSVNVTCFLFFYFILKIKVFVDSLISASCCDTYCHSCVCSDRLQLWICWTLCPRLSCVCVKVCTGLCNDRVFPRPNWARVRETERKKTKIHCAQMSFLPADLTLSHPYSCWHCINLSMHHFIFIIWK